MASKKPVSKKTVKTTAKTTSKRNAPDAGLVARAREAAQEVWMAGLESVAQAQESGGKVITAITRESRAAQTRMLDVAQEIKGRLQTITNVSEKINGRFGDLGDFVGDRAALVLGRAGVATKKEVQTLSRRVSKLAAEVERVAGAKKTAVKPVVKAAIKPVARKAKPVEVTSVATEVAPAA